MLTNGEVLAEFNGGALHHPDTALQAQRLLRCLAFVLEHTGEEGERSFRQWCKIRHVLDLADYNDGHALPRE